MRSVSYLLGVLLVVSSTIDSNAAATIVSTADGVLATVNGKNSKFGEGSSFERGARIVVARSSNAAKFNVETVVRYDNGCEVRLRQGAVYTIADQSPCDAVNIPPAESAAGFAVGPAAIGGVAIVGVVVGGVLAATSGKSSRNPIYISP